MGGEFWNTIGIEAENSAVNSSKESVSPLFKHLSSMPSVPLGGDSPLPHKRASKEALKVKGASGPVKTEVASWPCQRTKSHHKAKHFPESICSKGWDNVRCAKRTPLNWESWAYFDLMSDPTVPHSRLTTKGVRQKESGKKVMKTATKMFPKVMKRWPSMRTND